ncbi:MAG: FAD-dependent oxidoreductase [bacterium]|nr:FAD-dependent oxidoreductase [bacterium]
MGKDVRFEVTVPDESYWSDMVKCRAGCPVHTDARGYVRAIAEGRFEEAYRIAREPNPFASVCGRVCAAPCEAACRRGAIDAPVAIRSLKRFLTERYGSEAKRPLGQPKGLRLLLQSPPLAGGHGPWDLANLRKKGETAQERTKGRRVAVVGSGVAGMTCAHDLKLLGYDVTVFEAQSVPGGMLMLGVPEYRLPRDLVQAEIQGVLDLGVELRLNQALGRDFTLADLRAQGFESVFIAIGAHKSRDLRIEGVQLDGVFRAVEFLLNVNLGFKVELGERVVVVGGGDVAMDAARSAARAIQAGYEVEMEADAAAMSGTMDVAREAIRMGARNVRLVCLESWEEMPASELELEGTQEEGIEVHPRWGPKRVLGEGGKVRGLEVLRVIRVFDEEGRFNPQFEEGSEDVMECDSVILAVGQAPDLSWIREEDKIEVSPRGTIQIDPDTLATTASGIYAGGDVAFGPRIFIEAVENGHRAARSIHEHLTGESYGQRRGGMWKKLDPHRQTLLRIGEPEMGLPVILPGYRRFEREEPLTLPVERRIGIAEVELGYTEDAARQQAARCVQCGINTIFDSDKCVLCGGCVDVCPSACLRIVPLRQLSGGAELEALARLRYGEGLEEIRRAEGEGGTPAGAAMLKDEAACIRCSLCAMRCPTGAVTMERYFFGETWPQAENPLSG